MIGLFFIQSTFFQLFQRTMTITHKAKCFCGEIEFKVVTEKKPLVGNCHCDTCRRWHAASMFTSCIFNKPTSFEITKGEESLKHIEQGKIKRNFCGKCGGRCFNSWPGGYGIPLTLIEDVKPGNVPKHLQVGAHVCYEEAIISIPDGKIKFNGIPAPNSLSGMRFFTMIKEYFSNLSLITLLGYVAYLKYWK